MIGATKSYTSRPSAHYTQQRAGSPPSRASEPAITDEPGCVNRGVTVTHTSLLHLDDIFEKIFCGNFEFFHFHL